MASKAWALRLWIRRVSSSVKTARASSEIVGTGIVIVTGAVAGVPPPTAGSAVAGCSRDPVDEDAAGAPRDEDAAADAPRSVPAYGYVP